jgi:predicted MPP superfamily phosphohydrolase
MRYILVPAIVYTTLHIYLWRRLVWDTQLPRAARLSATLLFVVLAATPPLAIWVGITVSRVANPALTAIGFSWISLVAYLTTFLVLADTVRASRRLFTRARSDRPPTDQLRAPSSEPAAAPEPAERELRETRRLFVQRAVVGSALAASGGIVGLGVRAAVWDIATPEIAVRLARFPRALDGYKIALLTDVHIGPMLDGRFLRHLVEQTNLLRPDLIAIGGDLVDGRVREIGPQIEELRHLRARDGVYFVTGNHEYYSGAHEWLPFLSRLGVRVLQNEHLTLGDPARDGARFDLAGVTDHRHHPDARAATLGRDPERELIMLAHQPVQIAQSASVGAGLQLSGHTHGGQLLPFGAIALIDQPYLAGLHRHGSSATQIYISCGAGFWGPPVRVLAPAEIALLRLHA